jgi:hypothetical protein
MADKKISQLTSATTPLAGTETLPIVQSGSTVKVAADDLTVKNVRSNATTGILQVAGPGASTTRTMTVPNANFTAARTDAGQTLAGNQVFSGTLISRTATGGNLVLDSTTGGTENTLTGLVDNGNLFGIINYVGVDHVFKYGSQENFRIDLNGDAIIKQANRALVFGGNGNVFWRTGAGTPEGAVIAPVGSLFTRTDGGAGTTLYVKESGAGNTGWVAK